MDTRLAARDRLVNGNQNEYGYRYDALTFPAPLQAAAALAERARLLEVLKAAVEVGCRGTKLDCRNLSPGCRCCVAGGWSCLFINGLCNGRCFYCPAPQDERGVPTTNSLAFPDPADYVAYLEAFGFTGASISGGEPLLTPKLTLRYLAAIKEHFGPAIHTWLYTNGTLLTPDLLRELQAIGLDEIRLDIGATRYRLKQTALAARFLPLVTVEIPAVPEELPHLKALLPELLAAGVAHLNLHQLRLTPHNYPQLLARGYTFLHGEKVTVLDSELAALELLRHAVTSGCQLPVNYCSFVYKHRFQGAAARSRAARSGAGGGREVTAAGYLRQLELCDEAETLRRLAADLTAAGCGAESWTLAPDGSRLAFAAGLWPRLAEAPGEWRVNYAEASICPASSGRLLLRGVPLSGGRSLVVERQEASGDLPLSRAQLHDLERWLGGDGDRPWPESLAGLAPWEVVPAGLQDYF